MALNGTQEKYEGLDNTVAVIYMALKGAYPADAQLVRQTKPLKVVQ